MPAEKVPSKSESQSEKSNVKPVGELFGKKGSTKLKVGNDNKFKPRALLILVAIVAFPFAYLKFSQTMIYSQPSIYDMSTGTASWRNTQIALIPKTPTLPPTWTPQPPTNTLAPTPTRIPTITPTPSSTPTLPPTLTPTPANQLWVALLPVYLKKNARTSSGVYWQDVVGFGAACPPDFPMGSMINFTDGDGYLCVDRSSLVSCDRAICQLQIFLNAGDTVKQKPRLAYVTLPTGEQIAPQSPTPTIAPTRRSPLR